MYNKLKDVVRSNTRNSRLSHS